MPAPNSHRRLLVAAAASVLLHAAIALWVATRPKPAPVPTGREPVEVTIAFTEPAPPPPEPPKVVPPPPPVVKRAPSPRPAPAPVAQEAPEPEAPTPLPSTPVDAPTADAPRAVDGPRTLTPRLEVVQAPEVDSDFAVTPEQEEGLRAPEQVAPEDLPRHIARETMGRARVERGLVHPYYTQLGKALLKKWDADRAVSRHGLKGFGEQFAENSKAWNRIWMEHASAYGSSGNPVHAEGGAQPSRRPATVHPQLDARRELRKQMRKEFRATRKATLKVIQDAQGRLLSVELVKPSNDPKVDKEALVDVRAAAQELPAPPPEAMGGRTELVSMWQFELIISISPPIPTFSFEFDEALGFIDPRLPLDRRIYKRVRLLSVD